MMKKPTYTTYFILILSLGAVAFLGVCNPRGMRQNLGGVAARIDDDKITAHISLLFEVP